MFGFGKKKLLRKMDGLASVAQMAVYLSLKEDNEKSMDSSDASLFAAAISNYLFGKTADPGHVEQFTLERIKSEGNQTITNNISIRKLVVQSLRVLSTIAYAQGKEVVGMDILSTYGKEFPDSPNPDSYLSVIQESIQAMSSTVQESLSQRQQ